jgi:hypothetical protein
VRVFGVSLLVAAVVAAAATAAPQKNYYTFKTAGGLIECGMFVAGKYSESLLRCDIRTGLKPKVKRPKGCHFDYGSTLELRPGGRAFAGCVSDAIAPINRVLRVGQNFDKGPFKCALRKKGLYCSNKSGNAFFLSKQRWYRYRF